MICRRDWKLALACAVSIFVGLSACGEEDRQPAPLTLARAELANGNALEAERILQRELKAGVPKQELAALFGEAALARGDLPSARRWLAKGDFSKGTAGSGFRMLGRLEMADGNLEAAGKAFDQALAKGDENPELWVDIGRLRYLGGEQFQAIEAAAKALEVGPRNAAALQFRGQLLRDAEGLVPAISYFVRAVELQPDHVGLRNELAATLGDAGRAGDALAVLRDRKGIAERSSTGLFIQAVIAARAGDALLAREMLLRSGLSAESQPAALLLSAIIDIEAENYASAAQQLDRLHRSQPDNRRVSELFAYALSRSGGERELVRRFSTAAESGSPFLQMLVGRAYESLDERSNASRFLDSAAEYRSGLMPLPGAEPLARSTGGSQFDVFSARDLARNAVTKGTPDLAVHELREFVRRNPGSGDGYAILGDVEFAAGHRQLALEAYRRSAAIRRNWPLLLRLIATQGRGGDAVEILRTFVEGNPLNGEAAAMLADAYGAQGDWARAASLLDRAMSLGMERVPWVLAGRSVAAAQLGKEQEALDYALLAHDLQPMNPKSVAALISALPEGRAETKLDLEQKLRSLPLIETR